MSWYNDVFGGVHTAGKLIATAFGGGALAQQVETLESPALPAWAKSDQTKQEDAAKAAANAVNAQAAVPIASAPGAPAPPSGPPVVLVTAPDYVMVIDRKKTTRFYENVAQVAITGGKRFPGNGYSGGGASSLKFSFGYDAPPRLDILMKNGLKSSLLDVKQVVFGGGQESVMQKEKTQMDFKVLGDQILGEMGVGIVDEGDDYELIGANPYLNGAVGHALQSRKIGTARTYPAVRPRTMNLGGKVFNLPPKVQTRLGFVVKETPRGRKFTSLGVTKRHLTPEQTIANAKDVGKRAVAIGNQLLAQVKKMAKAAKAAKNATKVHGLVFATHRRASGHPTLSLAQLKKIADDTIKTGKKLGTQADKYSAQHETHLKVMQAGLAAAVAKIRPRVGGTSVQGDVVGDGAYELEILGAAKAMYEVIGADPGDVSNPDSPDYNPSDPAYDPKLDPSNSASPFYDPNTYPPGSTGAGTGTTDTSASGYTGTAAPGPDQNYGLPPAPTLDSVKADFLAPGTFDTEADPRTTYTTLPTGAVPFIWDPSTTPPPPFKAITSYDTYPQRRAAGPLPTQRPAGGIDNQGVGAGFEWHGDNGAKWFVYWPANGPTNNVSPPNAQEASNLDTMFDAGIAHGWGPLLGAITMPDWQGLRYLHDGNQTFFWFRDQAPSWAIGPLLQAALDQATTNYAAQLGAAKTAYAQQVAQDALAEAQAQEQAKQQAITDAQTTENQKQETQAAQHQADLQAISDQSSANQQQQFESLYEQQAAFDAQQRAQYGAGGGGYDPNNPPDPNNPGYLMDGSLDPAYGGGDGGFNGGYGTGMYDPANPPDPQNPGYLMDGSPDPAGIDWGDGSSRDQLDQGGSTPDYSSYGSEYDASNPPDPSNPGYLMDGTPDPNAMG